MFKKQRTPQYSSKPISTVSLEDMLFPCLTLLPDTSKVADDDSDWKNCLSNKSYVATLAIVSPQPASNQENSSSTHSSTSTSSNLFKRPRLYDLNKGLHEEFDFMFRSSPSLHQ